MDFTKLRSFNKAYPLFVEKYELFSLGENASITDKINSVVQALNKVGKLSNDVLKDWNKVMEWAMGEGLDESVDKKVEQLIANGLFDELIQLALTDFNEQVESLETQLAEIATNVKSFGAVGNGIVTNEDIAINNALTNNSMVYVPNGTYKISNTIVIPAGKKLFFGKNVTIIPTANIDIFQVNANSCIDGGFVDVGGVVGWNKAIVTIPASVVDNLNIYRLKAKNSVANPLGRGFSFDCTTDTTKVLMFSRFVDFYFEGFKYGIYIKSLLGDTNFANNNHFSGLISFCPNAVWNESAEGNYYNLHGQSASTVNNEPTVYIKGGYNQLTGFIFDVGLPGHSKTYVELDGVNNIVNVPIPSNLIIDHKQGKNSYTQTLMHIPPTKGVTDYYGSGTYFAGDQDNFLVSADKRFNVSETFTNVANWSALSYAFRTNGSVPVTYHFNDNTSLTDNAKVLVNLGTAYIIRLLGVTIPENGHPKKLVLELFSSADNQWHSKEFYPTGAGAFVWDIASELSYSLFSTVTQLRVTVYQPAIGSDVNISSIFAHSPIGGNAFLPTHGGTVYGDLDFIQNTGVILKSPDGTKYRITVANGGALSSVVVP